jgi:hypothetical protein
MSATGRTRASLCLPTSCGATIASTATSLSRTSSWRSRSMYGLAVGHVFWVFRFRWVLYYSIFSFGCLKPQTMVVLLLPPPRQYRNITCCTPCVVVMAAFVELSMQCTLLPSPWLTANHLHPQCTWYRALWIECKMPTQQLPQLLQKVQDEVYVLKLP